MVLRGSGGEERSPTPAPNRMTTSPKRSNHLPNFTLPFLKWGSQRYLRCTNSGAAGGGAASARWDQPSPCSGESATKRETEERPMRGLKRLASGGGGVGGGCDDSDGGIAVVRRRLMLDLKTEADRMKDAILGNGKEQQEAEESARPWNLRARRGECRPSGEKPRGDCPSPARNDGGAVRVPKLRSESEKPTPRREKFSLQLTKAEVEEDFMAMTGRRPRARPSKRPKAVQKKLDTLSPGLWLTEVTPDLYKVHEANDKGKGKGKSKDDESL